MTSHTAIIFFSYSASREARYKDWCDGNHLRNKQVASSLISDTMSVLKSSGLPVFHFDEENQRGDSFTERFNNAFHDVFSLGYEAVVAVGNDCPALRNISWSSVEALLKEGTPVFGPSLRGGVYLLGLTKALWEEGALAQIPWKTSHVLSALQSHWAECYLLNPERDLNTKADIQKFLREQTESSLLMLFFVIHVSMFISRFSAVSYAGEYWGLRAPPVMQL
jgi:hypothetical protein